MTSMNPDKNRRVLVIDDNKSIHDDFRKILSPDEPTRAALDVTETELFGNPVNEEQQPQFEIDSAYQGPEGVTCVKEALEAGRPYAMAFVDMRMPPGWDGIKTAQKLLEVDPEIQVVICTAYSAYSWDEISEQIGNNDRMVSLNKPFDTVEALRLANALTEKWHLVHFDLKKTQRLTLKYKRIKE
jgi:CheY-like chemotaxis protein